MGNFSIHLFLGLVAFSFVPAAVLGGGRTLVLLDSHFIKETHSRFFRTLKGEKRVGGRLEHFAV